MLKSPILKLTLIFLLLSILCLSCKKKDGRLSNKQNSSKTLQVKTLILKERGYERFPNIYHYENLEYLDLSNNSISEIPKQITALKRLKKLYLSENNIKVIPNYISKLDSLWILDFSYNDVEVVSLDVCSMKNLKVLDLNENPNSNLPNCLKSTSKTIVLNTRKVEKIHESKIQNNTKTFLEIIKTSSEEYYDYPKENYNNFRAEAKVFNLMNVIDTLDFIEHGVFDDLVLKKGIYVFTITNRINETFLFVSDDFFTFSTGYRMRHGKRGYNYFNLGEQLENFIQNNPGFIKNEVEKSEIIHRLQYKTYRRITSLR